MFQERVPALTTVNGDVISNVSCVEQFWLYCQLSVTVCREDIALETVSREIIGKNGLWV